MDLIRKRGIIGEVIKTYYGCLFSGLLGVRLIVVFLLLSAVGCVFVALGY